MKKGFVHIDWVISFGIFVIFLLLIFIWFGPALGQDYDNDYLKTIAEQGFETETYVNVLEHPIYFESNENLNGEVINVSLPTNKNIDNISKLFTPYFTTKTNGTGLGLAQSRKIMKAHNGEIDVLATSPDGSTFALILPGKISPIRNIDSF